MLLQGAVNFLLFALFISALFFVVHCFRKQSTESSLAEKPKQKKYWYLRVICFSQKDSKYCGEVIFECETIEDNFPAEILLNSMEEEQVHWGKDVYFVPSFPIRISKESYEDFVIADNVQHCKFKDREYYMRLN